MTLVINTIQRHLAKITAILFSIVWFFGCIAISPTSQNVDQNDCLNQQNQISISQIQGTGHRSPFDGDQVRCVRGIVTTIDGGGFYLQSKEPDADPKTSEAIYVDLLNFASLKVGDEVMISSGTVREYNPAGLEENSLTITSLRTKEVEILSHGNALPAPILLGEGGRAIPDQMIENDVDGYVGSDDALFDPDEDGMDFFESLESMRVQVNNAVAISSINSYNEVVVLADLGKNASGLNPDGVLLLGEYDPNPERLMLDDKFIRMPNIQLGDVFTQPIVGIIDYDFGNYRIQPTEKLVFQAQHKVENITAVELPELRSSQITVASLNVFNLSHRESPERVNSWSRMITYELGSPDVMVLQEVMDDDGRLDSEIVSADENITSLADAIQNAGGPVYRWFNIDPLRKADGGVEGGNIRVVIMFRLDRGLKFLSAPAGEAGQEVGLLGQGPNLMLTHNPGLIWPNNSAFNQSRKPIIAQFQFLDQNFFVIGVHFNSKGPDGPMYGDRQPPNLDSERKRVAQAKAVNGFVKDILELDLQAKILVAGDLNDFPWSDSIQTLVGKQLVNLFDSIDRQGWFTYIYQGNGQVLDQMLLSESFIDNLVQFRPLNLNSVLPANEQISDHDPIIAVFDFAYYE